jgi:hypothetical protein
MYLKEFRTYINPKFIGSCRLEPPVPSKYFFHPEKQKPGLNLQGLFYVERPPENYILNEDGRYYYPWTIHVVTLDGHKTRIEFENEKEAEKYCNYLSERIPMLLTTDEPNI